MLKIRETTNVGKCKYVVNFHTGEKHADGSDFYGIRIFRNRKMKDKFITELWEKEKEESINGHAHSTGSSEV